MSLLLRGIVKAMGLTGKITPDQVAKKWDNLKSKFKVRRTFNLWRSLA